MKYLKRLFFAPLLLKLHAERSRKLILVQIAQQNLWDMCEVFEVADVKPEVQALETALLDVGDIDERMGALWH